MRVRPLTPDDQRWKEQTLERGWGSTSVARLGELVDVAPLPGFVALDGDGRVGLLTYAARDDGIEVVTIESLAEGLGVGTALMDAVRSLATAGDATRIWLVTTNDNVRAIGFYQRWGMDLVGVIRDGVTRSRLVKPSIPTVGQHGIPMRHELEFELVLSPTPR
jgi:ribosomal protein S18 acetylase RimI-like enzyme